MKVIQKFLIPGVEYADKADPATKAIVGVFSKFKEGRGDSLKEHIIDDLLIGQGNGVNLVGESKDIMEIDCGQKLGFSGLKPLCFGEGLAFWAVPITAGVISVVLKSAPVTLLKVAPKLAGAAN